jgi:hypothetical protein
MKNSVLKPSSWFLTIMLCGSNVYAQQLIQKDIDLMVGKHGVLYEMKPKRFEPASKICFDKRFWFSTNITGRVVKGCFYLNTKDGYVGMSNARRFVDCEVNINSLDLDFLIISKMGQNVAYTNDKREGKRYMSIPIRIPPPPQKRIKKHGRIDGERRRFTDMSLPTWAYYDPLVGTFPKTTFRYLYGPNHMDEGYTKNYLGNFGIGFMDVQGETFVCLSQEMDDKFTTVDRIENVNFCFDATAFKDGDAAAIQIGEEVVADTRQDLDERESELAKSDSYCVEFERRILEHDQSIAKKEEKALELQKSGLNMMNKAHQRIIAESQDAIDQVIKSRLKLLGRQCDARYTLDKIADTEGKRKRAKDKINCLQIDIDKLTALEEELARIDKANPNNPTKAMADKNVLYMRNRAASRSACN